MFVASQPWKLDSCHVGGTWDSFMCLVIVGVLPEGNGGGGMGEAGVGGAVHILSNLGTERLNVDFGTCMK